MNRLIGNGMTNVQKYDTILGILTAHYENETLEVGSPCGCVVGNLIAAAMGLAYNEDKEWIGMEPVWQSKFVTLTVGGWVQLDGTTKVHKTSPRHIQIIKASNVDDNALWQLEQIGLDLNTLMDIEWHFENGADLGTNEDSRMFCGLMEVLNYLEQKWSIGMDKHTEGKQELKDVFEKVKTKPQICKS